MIGLGQFSADSTIRYRELLAGSQPGLFSTFSSKTVENWKVLFCHPSWAVFLNFDQLLVFS